MGEACFKRRGGRMRVSSGRGEGGMFQAKEACFEAKEDKEACFRWGGAGVIQAKEEKDACFSVGRCVSSEKG